MKVGDIYQSRNFPNISRRVVRVKHGIVTYSILDSRKPDDPFNKMCLAVESEFMKCSITPTREDSND